MQIIVLGMHRSGTSLVTRIINMMGAYLGPEGVLLGYNTDNPKGFWERKDAVALNDELLAANGCTWDKLDAWRAVPLSPDQKRAIKSLVLKLDAHRPWVLKDPRMCITFPYWRPLLELPVCVVVSREPMEVARSLARRDNMTVEHGLRLWERHAASLLNASFGLPRIFVRHADMLAGPVSATHALHAALEKEVQGLRLPSDKEITAFIDPALYHEKADAPAPLSAITRELYAMLRGETKQLGEISID